MSRVNAHDHGKGGGSAVGEPGEAASEPGTEGRKPAEQPQNDVAHRERFAIDGYERATIRAIARDASIDPSMVMRYYGNKEKLFAAAAEFDLQLPQLRGITRDDVGSRLVEHFLDRWERDEGLMVLLRSAVTNDDAAVRMRAIFTEQLKPVIGEVVGGTESTGERAGLAASQILGMALARYILRFPPVVAMSRAEVVAWLGPTVQRYLAGRPEASV